MPSSLLGSSTLRCPLSIVFLKASIISSLMFTGLPFVLILSQSYPVFFHSFIKCLVFSGGLCPFHSCKDMERYLSTPFFFQRSYYSHNSALRDLVPYY